MNGEGQKYSTLAGTAINAKATMDYFGALFGTGHANDITYSALNGTTSEQMGNVGSQIVLDTISADALGLPTVHAVVNGVQTGSAAMPTAPKQGQNTENVGSAFGTLFGSFIPPKDAIPGSKLGTGDPVKMPDLSTFKAPDLGNSFSNGLSGFLGSIGKKGN